MSQVAIVHDARPGPYTFALVIKKQPFTRAQTFALEDAALKRGLQPIWIPHQAANRDFGPYPAVASAQLDLDGFVNWFANPENTGAALEIAPCPDNRPFVLDLTTGTLPVFKQLAIFALVLALGVLALGWRTSNTPLPTPSLDKNEIPDATSNVGRSALDVLYFLALGVGFMLVEIPLAQKLILPLGYPTLALSVILFSILLGGGLGAWFSQRFEGESLRRWAMGCALAVALLAAAGVLVLPLLDATMLTMHIVARCALATVLLLPLGFVLGTPFPSGIRLFAARGNESRVPLIWGLNGVASVVGSLLAAMGAKSMGFSAMLLCGAAVYVCAAGLLQATAAPKSPVENK
jgi:hypothetical protein